MSAGVESRPMPQRTELTYRDVLWIAVPIILSNATTPLIGLADTVVVGQLGQPHLIGGVAVGALIFSMLYWGFGFLRMGTTGLTAQAVGADDRPEVAAWLFRGLIIALGLGVGIILLQVPIVSGALYLVGGSKEFEATARTYTTIRIWSAPAGLVNFALLGWFIGLGRAGLAFSLQVLLNGLNILLAVALGLWLGWGVEGVGLGAALAEVTAAVTGTLVALREARRRSARATLPQILDARQLTRAFNVNRDIMIRSFSIYVAWLIFASEGARQGDVALAANAMLQNFMHIGIYMLDGFAFAAETLTGQAVGARDRRRFDRAVDMTTRWAVGFSLLVAGTTLAAGPAVIDVATTHEAVRQAARIYLPWVALVPIVGVWCFQLDGIFIGATRTADMRNMMMLSLVFYVAAWWVLTPIWGNHGLWAALIVLFVARGLTLWARYPALLRGAFGLPARSS